MNKQNGTTKETREYGQKCCIAGYTYSQSIGFQSSHSCVYAHINSCDGSVIDFFVPLSWFTCKFVYVRVRERESEYRAFDYMLVGCQQ